MGSQKTRQKALLGSVPGAHFQSIKAVCAQEVQPRVLPAGTCGKARLSLMQEQRSLWRAST